MIQTEEELRIVAKLMDESETSLSATESKYYIIYDLVNKKLPEIIDQGEYLANSSIILKLGKKIKQYKIFTIIPELIKKSVMVVIGNSYLLEKKLFNNIIKDSDWIGMNTNLPMVVVAKEGIKSNEIFALTYMDKLVPVNKKEYEKITKELYKQNIEIRKLIKCFVLYSNFKYKNLSFLILPEFADFHSEIVNELQGSIKEYIFFLDKEQKWKKIIKKYPYNLKHVSVLKENQLNQSDLSILSSKVSSEHQFEICDDFMEKCSFNDKPSINFAISTDITNVLLDVDVFYATREKVLSRKIEMLTVDSINLTETTIKKQVQNYRKKLVNQRDRFEECYKDYLRIEDEVIDASLDFEKSLSEILFHSLPDKYDFSLYKDNLISIFFKYLNANEFNNAKNIIHKLDCIGYKYSDALNGYLKFEQGFEVQESELVKIRQYPCNEFEIAKIKVAMSKPLGYLLDDLKEVVKYVACCSTGKEWYYAGKSFLDQKNYIDASKCFMRSLDFDYTDAGKELIKLANNHPECKIDVDELAENLVTEANYRVGIENLNKKYKKGVVNLKIAASKENIKAINIIADILFNKCKIISWQLMNKDENIHAVNNVINLYLYLYKHDNQKLYAQRVGLMYCKLKDYSRAYLYLKDINTPEALYECAKMHQYGNGVAKNLETAKKYYEHITTEYKDTRKQYNKVCNQIKVKTQKKEGIGYSETRNYSSSTSYSPSGSSYCFITTAACIALHEKKDCEQLNLLRKFRDEHMLDDNNDLVNEYYRIGPIIVKYIDMEWNPFAIYCELWEDYILPSCKKIETNEWNSAKLVYIQMVKMLCVRYSVKVKDAIIRKYLINC